MKAKPNWGEIEARLDFESVSRKLLNLSAGGALKRRKSASDLLDKVKEALLKARADGVSFAALAAFLTESGMPVSEPTLRHYLRGQGAGKKTRRKSAVAAKPKTQSVAEPEPKPETRTVQSLFEARRAETAMPPPSDPRIRGPRIADPQNL
jgi:hypothetical protein